MFVIPDRFSYTVAHSVEEAVELLHTLEDSKVLAGGQSLIPFMKLGYASPKSLVDINRIPNLDYLDDSGEWLKIGALTRISRLCDSELIAKDYPLIHDAALQIADPLVRNLGTFGGNVCHADMGNDLPAVCLAMNAEMVASGPSGQRVLAAKDFFVDRFTTLLASDELLTEVRIPKNRRGCGGAYLKLERRVGDYAIVGVAAQLEVDGDGVCRSVGIGLTSASTKPIKASEAESWLVGKSLSDEVLDKASTLAMNASNPLSDIRGPAEYKKAMVKVLTHRALNLAYKRARGGL